MIIEKEYDGNGTLFVVENLSLVCNKVKIITVEDCTQIDFELKDGAFVKTMSIIKEVLYSDDDETITGYMIKNDMFEIEIPESLYDKFVGIIRNDIDEKNIKTITHEAA